MRRLGLRLSGSSSAILVWLLCLAGCSGPAAQIIGRWKSTDAANPMVWEFSRDGGVMVGTEPGRYTLGDQAKIKIQTQAATFVHQVEFAQDRMIWTQANGAKLEFVRVP